MAKIRISGEYFEFDRNHKPMAEMLALEKELRDTPGTSISTYGQWENGLNTGSAEAMAVLIWLTWKRDGREKSLAEILAGDINLADLTIEESREDPGPTKEASSTTEGGTSGRSRKS